MASIFYQPSMVYFRSKNFGATIDLDMMPVLPLIKIRKLFKLMLSEPNRNTEAITTTEAWLAAVVAKTKSTWMETSKSYKENRRTTYSDGCVIPEAQQKKINKPLIVALKKAKAKFERASKIQVLFQKLKNKEK